MKLFVDLTEIENFSKSKGSKILATNWNSNFLPIVNRLFTLMLIKSQNTEVPT